MQHKLTSQAVDPAFRKYIALNRTGKLSHVTPVNTWLVKVPVGSELILIVIRLIPMMLNSKRILKFSTGCGYIVVQT